MKNLNKISLTLIGAAASLLTGCAATQKANESLDKNSTVVAKDFNETYMKSSSASVASNDVNKNANFGKTQRNWVNPTPLQRVEKEAELPSLFKKNVSMTMPGVIMASEILSEMQRSTNVTFNLAPDVYDINGGMGSLVTAGGGAKTDSKKSSPLMVSDFVFNGSLAKALDLLCAKVNLSWKWTGNNVEIYRYETRTYNIAALAGATKTTSNVDLKGDTTGTAAAGGDSGGGQAATGGSSNSSVQRSVTLTTWEEVKTFLLAQMSPGGNMAVLESAGTVSIKDLPSVHKRIDKSITDLNALLSKQIYLNVDIYAVTKNEGDDVGLDLQGVWNNSSKFGLGYSSTNGNTTGTSAPNSFSIGVLKGPFMDSKIMVRSLSTLGQTSIVNQFAVTTLNGQPTPIASNTKTGYLAKTESKADQNGNISVSLTPGEIASGINLNVTPKIEPNGNILLEYAMNLSELVDLQDKSTPDKSSTIQLPTSTLKSVLQRAVLRSGETLVLSGFKQDHVSKNKSGVGSPSNMLLGGSHAASVGSQYLVITVTPYIANSNAYNR